MTADEQLKIDLRDAVCDFKVGLVDIRTLSDHERDRISMCAQHLVADVSYATQNHVKAKLQETGVI